MQVPNRQCIFTCLGLGLISLALILGVFWMDIFRRILAKELEIAPGTKSFQMFKAPPLELYFDIYLFNWTNPSNLTNEDFEKPILQEVGPYRFREIPMKTKIKWHPKNYTISYRRKSVYYFIEEESVGRLDDKIVSINAVAVSAAHTARDWSYVMQKQVSMGLTLYGHQAYVIKEARELLFDGYEDDLINMASQMSDLGAFKFNMPYTRFGWMYDRNESDGMAGHFNVHTGQGDISQLGVTKEWNYAPETPYFPNPCNAVRGSAGEFYPPGQKKDRSIAFFSGEMCRYLDLYFEEEKQINGLNVYKYSGTERSVDNGTNYNEFECFSRDGGVPSGIMNVSACRYGAPAFVSFPHFYAADPYYLQFVDGVKPDKEKHEFYIAMEPETGIPIEVAARLQINVMVQAYPNVALYQEAPTFWYPAFWFEQKVRLTDDMISELSIVKSMPTIGYVCIGIMGLMGCILLIYTFCYQKFRQPELKQTLYRPDAIKKNGIPAEKIHRGAEQSPLMNDNKIIGNAEIKRIDEQHVPFSVPLALPESDFDQKF